MNTIHADVRAQQRGIPPMIDELLDRYGSEEHDHHGCVQVFFDKRSKRRMQQELGARAIAALDRWMNVYKVRSTDGLTITQGHRTRRIRRT